VDGWRYELIPVDQLDYGKNAFESDVLGTNRDWFVVIRLGETLHIEAGLRNLRTRIKHDCRSAGLSKMVSDQIEQFIIVWQL
jgi:hypothetical protein